MPPELHDPFRLVGFPTVPHRRKFAPTGYTDYKSFNPWLRDEFTFRCVYCAFREAWFPDGHDSLGVDHLAPKSESPGLECDYDNLYYACNRCNWLKDAARKSGLTAQIMTQLDPCRTAFGDRVRAKSDGTFEAVDATDRLAGMLIDVFQLDVVSSSRADHRRAAFRAAVRHAESVSDPDRRADFLEKFRYPHNLPNLEDLCRGGRKALKVAARSCCYALRVGGALPETY